MSETDNPQGSGSEQALPAPEPASTAAPQPAPAPEPAAPAPPPAEGSAPEAPEEQSLSSSRRFAAWIVAGLIVAAAGVGASYLGARSIARKDAGEMRTQQAAAGRSIESTLKLATTHEEEIATSSGTYLAGHPQATPAQLAGWASWARLLHRHPELQRLTLIEQVPSASLPSFAAQMGVRVAPQLLSRSPFGTGTAAAFTGVAPAAAATQSLPATPADIEAAAAALHVRPPGQRAFYCLTLGEVVRAPSRTLAEGTDYCAKSKRMLAVRDSGRVLYADASSPRAQALLALIPVYRGANAPRGLAARRSSLVGWVREVLEPQTLVAIALRGHEDEGIVLAHVAGVATTSFAGGAVHGADLIRVADLRNGWSASVYGATPTAAIFSHGDSRALLIVGTVLGLLAGGLLFVLGGREGTRPVAAAPEPVAPLPEPAPILYDELTGLPNMALTMDRADRMLARVGRQAGMLAGALIIDIDHFQNINERLGREAGDQVLHTVGLRLAEVIRGEDTVGRLEGDRFLILVEAVARGARLDSLARRVIESLHKPIELEGFTGSFILTASIGVAFGRYDDMQQMLRDAEAAVRSAKDSGRDRYTLYNANVRSVIEDRGVLEAELGRALDENQFFLVYQPVCDLRTNEVVSLEALLRWRHPLRGALPPSEFISVAEGAGLTVPIGRWALEEACTQAASWTVAGKQVGVSVMISRAQLNRDGLLTDVRRALQQSGLEPSMLTLEIEEATVMTDLAASAERLAELRRLGVRIAIDDFGSGYAYRADLQRMPVDYLKVDRSSLAAHEDEDYRTWLLEAILVFARDLSLTVIAKGVETAEHMTNLKAMGCTLAQGFFMGRPVPSEEVEGILRERGVSAPGAAADPAWTGSAAPVAEPAGVAAAAAPTAPAPAAPAASPRPTADAPDAQRTEPADPPPSSRPG